MFSQPMGTLKKYRLWLFVRCKICGVFVSKYLRTIKDQRVCVIVQHNIRCSLLIIVETNNVRIKLHVLHIIPHR